MGVFVMLLAAVGSFLAGLLRWPWYAVFASVLVSMAGFALHKPLPFSLQKQRGALHSFLTLLSIFLLMVCFAIYGGGRVVAALLPKSG